MDLSEAYWLLHTWGYPALLAALILTGVGLPIPEDLLLVLAGYLIAVDVFDWHVATPVAVGGVIASDLILFALGRHLGWEPAGRWDTAVVSDRRVESATRWFERLGPVIVFLARLIPGTRVVVFVTAGIRGMSAREFLVCDALGALVWVPALMAVGNSLASDVGALDHALELLHQGSGWLLGGAMVLFGLWLLWGREQSKL